MLGYVFFWLRCLHETVFPVPETSWWWVLDPVSSLLFGVYHQFRTVRIDGFSRHCWFFLHVDVKRDRVEVAGSKQAIFRAVYLFLSCWLRVSRAVCTCV